MNLTVLPRHPLEFYLSYDGVAEVLGVSVFWHKRIASVATLEGL